MIIRRQPEDFVVTERLAPVMLAGVRPVPDTAHRFALYELRKTSLTTPEATQRLASALGVSAGKIEHAGLKDKHAVTSQHVTVKLEGKGGGKGAPESAPRSPVDGPGWAAQVVGFVKEPITAAAIERNHFAITIRDMTRGDVQEVERRAKVLAVPGAEAHEPGALPALLIVNYFGDQRFGSARHGGGFAAVPLIKGDFEGALKLLIGTPARKDSGKRRDLTRALAGKWGDWKGALELIPRCPERRAVEELAAGKSFRDAFAALPYLVQQMSVEAYQSHLWNSVARRTVRALAGGAAIEADDDFGKMIFAPSPSVTPGAREMKIPMLSPETVIPEAPGREAGTAEPLWCASARAVLAAEAIALADLRIPGLRRPAFGSAPRPFIVAAEGFALSKAEPDELGRAGRFKRTATFELPRGAYATVVLRAIGQ